LLVVHREDALCSQCSESDKADSDQACADAELIDDSVDEVSNTRPVGTLGVSAADVPRTVDDEDEVCSSKRAQSGSCSVTKRRTHLKVVALGSVSNHIRHTTRLEPNRKARYKLATKSTECRKDVRHSRDKNHPLRVEHVQLWRQCRPRQTVELDFVASLYPTCI